MDKAAVSIKKPFKLYIDPEALPKGENVDGIEGEKCNNCGGFGYTIGINNKNISCEDCEKTGVKLPTRRELQTQISEIRRDMFTLKQALLNILESNGVVIPKKLKNV